ncbi:uncharacterized protein LOC129573924 isoform X4 [Sitodiplosis mosellana]|uniref:uncharacterized protein LOC129573924 isoform X4 n=1 Tax=Sitodiplosis mosellana TaxID=263140 RepID=UPI00244499D3|nr:uncharacterized protein LOC129573924 isoform X4 [Sitodiplosis mosellana]
MASQQTRSAFKLTSIATNSVLNSITRLIIRLQMHSGTLFWVCVLFGIRSTISYSSDAEESIVLPKFGDRISPRTRTFIEVEKLRTTTTNNNNNSNNNNKFSTDINAMSNPNFSADIHSYNSVNSNNSNKTEHGFYINEASSSASAIDSHSGSNSVSVSYNEHSTNGPSRQSKHPHHQQSPPPSPPPPLTTTTNHHKRLAAPLQYNNNVYNSDDNVDSVEFDVIDNENDIYNALLRQHKSLNIGANADAYSDPSVENNLCNNKSEPCSNGGGSGGGGGGDGSSSDIELSNEIDLRNGNSTSAQAHRLEMSTEFFVVPSTSSSTIPSSHHLPGGIILPSRPKSQASIVPPLSHSRLLKNSSQPTIVSTHHSLGLRKEPWVVPVLVLTSLVMLMMAAFEIFVLCKAWQTSPSRRHLFLGQMLLLGLFLCACLAAVLTLNPTVGSCGLIRFGSGVAFALVFASLLVKCVFLISLNSGVYLPAPYQGLLLLFAVLIQVAIGGQWLLTTPADVESVSVPLSRNGPLSLTHHSLLLTAQDISMTTTIPLCKTHFTDLLYSLVYVIFLILFVAVLAIKSRRIRENYREATYIGLAICGSIPIWLGWTLCGLAVADRHKDACLAFGLIATSATVFLVMFMPKGRQLAAMGKEDRDEQLSSLSRTGSGYSPSFFHFKPIKYGVMGNTLASNTNTVNNTTIKHQAVASLGNGLFIRPTDENNLYTTLEPTMSSNPNVYFQRGNVHPGMIY